MGYRGKLREREEARRLRAQNKTLQQIADELRVSKSSVSLWVRDVPFTPSKRRYGPRGRPHPAQVRKLREIEECNEQGRRHIGWVSEKRSWRPALRCTQVRVRKPKARFGSRTPIPT